MKFRISCNQNNCVKNPRYILKIHYLKKQWQKIYQNMMEIFSYIYQAPLWYIVNALPQILSDQQRVCFHQNPNMEGVVICIWAKSSASNFRNFIFISKCLTSNKKIRHLFYIRQLTVLNMSKTKRHLRQEVDDLSHWRQYIEQHDNQTYLNG